MSISSSDIDRVVREVLAELGAAPGKTAVCSAHVQRPATAVAGVFGAPPTPRPQSRGVEAAVSSNARSDGDLVLTARVVSTDELLGRLDSVRRVVVSRRAIVTPAARDELLRRGIALEYADSDYDRRPAVCLAMIASGTDFDAAPLAAALERDGFSVERSQSDCAIAAVDGLAKATSRPDTLGVLLTPHAAAGLCLANRLSGVRAIGASAAPEAARAAAAVGANLLVVDPRAVSFFQLKQIVAEFGRGGVRPCPAVFRERLT